MKNATTKLLVVEDEPLFSELLLHTLESQEELEVVGTARDGETGVQMARQHKPDAVVMDIELACEMDVIEAALVIKEEMPDVGIVILSSHRDRRYLTSLPLERSSVWAYLLKQSVPDITSVVRAIQGSIMGMVVLNPAVMGNLRPRQGSAIARLTPRQQQVLELIAQGYNNNAIAGKLTLTPKSVETYIHAIYQELHLSNEPDTHARVQATLHFLENSEGNR